MGAVDKSDLILSSIETVRKTVKWYKKSVLSPIRSSIIECVDKTNSYRKENTPHPIFNKV